MTVFATLFAVSLSLTSPSQYTFTTNRFDASFFVGEGIGSDIDNAPYSILRLEDAAFLTEATWERIMAHYISNRDGYYNSIECAQYEFSHNSYYRSLLPNNTPLHSLRNFRLLSVGDVFVCRGMTNVVDGSFVCSSPADALVTGCRVCSSNDDSYCVNGIATKRGQSPLSWNFYPLIGDQVKFDIDSMRTNLYNGILSPNYDIPVLMRDITDIYHMVGIINGGAEFRLVNTYDTRYERTERLSTIALPKTYVEYHYTYTDQDGNTHTNYTSYVSSYDYDETPHIYTGVYTNHVESSSRPQPYRMKSIHSTRLYARRYNDSRYGQDQTYRVIDNGVYDDEVYVDKSNWQGDNSSVITLTSRIDSNGFGAGYANGTNFGTFKLFVVSRGTAMTINTREYRDRNPDTQASTISTTVITNATRFVNVAKATSSNITRDGDVVKIVFNGSICDMVANGVNAATGVFSSLPMPTALAPNSFGGMTSRALIIDGSSSAENKYEAQIVCDSVVLVLQSSPTYHARVP